jgi:transglutaminase-like putative cysteine protease
MRNSAASLSNRPDAPSFVDALARWTLSTSFSSLYRLSFYAMLVFATLVLSVDAVDSRIAMLFPVLVASCGVVALLTVDRNPEIGMSRSLANMLGLASVGLSVLEYKVDERLLLLSLGHWLVYLQLILMFRPKTIEEDWYLFGLGLVQVLVGTVLSQSDKTGAMMFIWAILALWVLGLFSLQRDAIRARGGSAGPRVPGADPREPYPGLFNVPYLFSAFRVTLTTLALGGVIFLAMPRRMGLSNSTGVDSSAQHLTGFDDEVQLGQLGEILESDNIVMSIELFDENDSRISLDWEPRWRGVTLAEYQNGRWYRQQKTRTTFPTFTPRELFGNSSGRPWAIVRQQIKLESNDSSVLFGLRPMIDAFANRGFGPELNAIDGSISRADTRSGTLDYEVRSLKDPDLPQPGEGPVSEYRKELMLRIPEAMAPRLKAIAEAEIARLVPEKREDVRERAKALEQYLRDSGEFGYTLKLDTVDANIDPVEDFLVNRKEGHCEYFASALTLLLRSVGIPARMVNGFKGGDWNELAKVLSVRQKHAHSWVEAYVGQLPGRERMPLWLTLDPTPGNERNTTIAKVGGIRANFRQVSDLIRYVWVFYIVGYNAERQDRLLYRPIRRLINDARRGFRMMIAAYTAAKERLARLLHFPDMKAFISVRGFVVAFMGLLVLVGLVRAAAWLARRLLRWYRGNSEEAGALLAGAAHYRRLAQLLSEVGLVRPPAETQEEFAHRATVFLTGRGSNTQAVADVPKVVVEAFYRVRFGRLEVRPEALGHLESRLNALEASLKATQS